MMRSFAGQPDDTMDCTRDDAVWKESVFHNISRSCISSDRSGLRWSLCRIVGGPHVVLCEDLYITHYLTPLRGALLAQRHYLQMVAEVVKR